MLPADVQLDESYVDAVRRNKDLQRQMCDPRENPDAAAFFVFNFCFTQDEEQGGRIALLPDPRRRPHGLAFLEALDRPRTAAVPKNLHDEKSRRMWHTWIACFYNLWALQWVKGYTALLISASEDHVDDSGRSEKTKTFSMFSRIRFAYERLPDHVRRGVNFAFMSGVCPENDAWVMGRAPTKTAGRGGGFGRAFVDECAHIEWMRAIHTALDPACKHGKVYMSTVNGPDNVYAEIKKERRDGWDFFEADWKEDPDKTVGIRETEPGPERERYGSHVSPWLIRATASLNSEDIAQEYGRNYEKSTKGMILREYSRSLHVRAIGDPRGPLTYDPTLPLHVALDLGHARKMVALISQPIGMRKLRFIGEYFGEFRNSPDNAKALKEKILSLGYRGQLGDVVFTPDPSAMNDEVGSGLAQASWYRAVGFENIALPRIIGPDSVRLGNDVVRALFARNMIEIDEAACPQLIDAIPSYRLPIDRASGEITSNKPIHNMASHPGDTLRYAVTVIWTADDLPYDGFIGEESSLESAPVRAYASPENREPEFTDGKVRSGQPTHEDDDLDVFASIASDKRVF